MTLPQRQLFIRSIFKYFLLGQSQGDVRGPD